MALPRRITLLIMSLAALALVVAVLPGSPSYAASVAPAPELVSPANNTDIAIKDLVLKWRPVAGASGYQVEISRNRDFTNNKVTLPSDGLTTATVYEVPLGLPHATYFWRVRAVVNGQPGKWAAPREFLREWEAPISVVHTPSDTDPTLSWAPIRGASEYHVIFSPDGPVSTKDLLDVDGPGCFTANTSFTLGTGGSAATAAGKTFKCEEPDFIYGAKYYWGLAAFDDTDAGQLTLTGTETGCGTKLPECDAITVKGGPFTLTKVSGGSVQTLTGLKTTWHANSDTQNTCNAEVPCPTTPTFSWTPVEGADFYQVKIYLDRDATTIYREYNAVTGMITPPDQFQDAQPSRPYFWEVEASTCGGEGILCTAPAAANQGCPAPSTGTATPSPAPSTTPAPAPTVTGVSVSPAGPSGDQSMQGGTVRSVTLTGSNIANGACVIASGGVVTTVPGVAQNTVTFSYWAPVAGGSVTFKIENPDGQVTTEGATISVASSAHSLALSAINTFQKRSGPVTLRSPANGAVKHGPFTFKWDDFISSGSQGSYDAENYRLQVSTTKSFTSNVIDLDTIDLTRYTPTTNALSNGHYFWRVNVHDETGNELTWSAPREVVVNSKGPQVSFTTSGEVGPRHKLSIAFTDLVKGVNSKTLKIVPDGYPKSAAVAGKVRLGASPLQYTFTPRHPLATGGTYDIVVSRSLKDRNGNRVVVTGAPAHIKGTATNKSHGWNYSRGWVRHFASGSISGSYVEANAGRSAKLKVMGDEISLIGCKGPSMGTISVILAGKTHRISEHQSFTRCGVTLWHSALPTGIHKLRILVSSGHGNFDAVKVD